MKLNLFILLLLAGINSFGQKIQTAFVIPEKDLIPEGIAYDAKSKTFFLSSIFKNKIIRIDQHGKITDFVSSKQDGIGQVLGMKVADGILWACNNSTLQGGGISMIHQYDIITGKLLRKWVLEFLSPERHLFNDLIIQAGTAYISDSDDGSVYQANDKLGKPALFLKDNRLRDINGITLLNDQHLVVNASTGFFTIDLQKGEIKRLPFEGYFPLGIDGLVKFKQSLIGIQNVVFPVSINQYFLNSESDKIMNAKVLLADHPLFKIPTTGVIAEDSFYFIANSQLLNLDTEKIKDPAKLKEVVIMKIKLD